MVIKRIGHSCFRLRGVQTSVICDPYDPKMLGIDLPRMSGDIVTVSHAHNDHNAVDKIMNNPFVIDGPGEYEVKGVRIKGLSCYHDNKKGAERGRNIAFVIDIDEIIILHCGDLGHKFTDIELDKIGTVDILLVPVGGLYTIDAETAADVVGQIEPRIVIPMHYQDKRLNKDSFGKLGKIEDFLKAIGKEDAGKEDKLVISKFKLPEELEAVILG